jgi:hypothetical protein
MPSLAAGPPFLSRGDLVQALYGHTPNAELLAKRNESLDVVLREAKLTP